jgi:hypothetical protein
VDLQWPSPEITEAATIHPAAGAHPHAPHIDTDAQVQAWKNVYFTPTSNTLSDLSVPQVVDAVHARSEENGWAKTSEPEVIGLFPNGMSTGH